MPLYDFRCANGHITERLAPIGAGGGVCPRCSEPTERMVGGARAAFNIPPDPKYRVSLAREAGEELAYQHTKRENEVGHPIKQTDYFSIARRRAAARGGVIR